MFHHPMGNHLKDSNSLSAGLLACFVDVLVTNLNLVIALASPILLQHLFCFRCQPPSTNSLYALVSYSLV
jgi:hypothetical protein